MEVYNYLHTAVDYGYWLFEIVITFGILLVFCGCLFGVVGWVIYGEFVLVIFLKFCRIYYGEKELWSPIYQWEAVPDAEKSLLSKEFPPVVLGRRV